MSKLNLTKKETIIYNFSVGLYNSFINKISKYIFAGNFCFKKEKIDCYKNKILTMDIKSINDEKATYGFELLKDGKYINIIKNIKTSYDHILNKYKGHNLCPFKYDVNIFSHNMKSELDVHLDREVLYTKLLSYFFNVKDLGIYLYKSVMKLLNNKIYAEMETIRSEAEKEIKINDRTRRIDIFIESNPSCIIEAKTKSQHHDHQLEDYFDYRQKNNVTYFIYLVLDKSKFIIDDNWYNMTWFQLACALYTGLIDSKKKDTPAGIYLQFFISNILYHLYHVDYYDIEGNASLSDSFHSMRYIINFINNVENME